MDASTGSLGQGASIAVGMALGAKHTGNPCHVYAVLGDGELQEGIVWEAAMAAAHYRLDNLTFIVRSTTALQIDGTNDQVMGLGDIARRSSPPSASMSIEVADGNDLEAGAGMRCIQPVREGRSHAAFFAIRVKGKGVSFMENQVGWHGKAPNARAARPGPQGIGGVSHE